MRRLIDGPRVKLRLIEQADLAKRAEWINDPVVQNSLHYDYPTSIARTLKWFDKIVLDSNRIDFSIFTSESGEYIGFCGFLNIDRVVKKAELHMVIGNRQYWGSGYGTEAYALLTNYGFLELGLNRIYGFQNVDNSAALAAVKKIGWIQEGTLRQDTYAHGKIYDRNVVSILREEWEKHARYDF
jgi:RimJ/RimL family protein N-acetyltransferase